MAKTNQDIVTKLITDAWWKKWETGSDRPIQEVIRCAYCFHSEPVPGDPETTERVYCITYDTFKRRDGFCELGTAKPKSRKEN